MKRRIIMIDDSLGIVLPKELLSKLGVGKGDFLYLAESEYDFTLSRCDPDFEEDTELAEETIKKYKDAFKKLGK